ncbi:MAG: RluA family pseudouridine synthase [Rhabdochlamydiaceae bacterium]
MITDSIIVEEEDTAQRIDKWLCSKYPTHSRSYFQFLIEQKAILVNGSPVKKRESLKINDEVEICFILTPEINLTPQPIDLNIVYEDEDLLIINKPPGLVVHPAPGHYDQTLVNGLLYYCQQLNEQFQDTIRPGIVHRLDKDTSGLLITAKNLQTHTKMVEMMSRREIEKRYLGITTGKPKEGLIDLPIGRHPSKRKEMCVDHEKGKKALTHLSILKESKQMTLIDMNLLTGRTHQIRVHLQYLKTPLIGDPVYGYLHLNHALGIKRQMLHAYRLSFTHPHRQTPLCIEAPPPADMAEWIKKIDQSS